MATTEPCVHIVDDEASVRDALTFLFGSHGLAARSYDGGPALMQALDSGPLRGCIVLDVRMEPHSGLQVHDALVERGVRVPVIFLSGHGDIPMAVDALKKGAFDFLEKPFAGDALVERVQRALRVEAAQQASAARGDEREARMASLSEREREVMLRVAAGKLNKVIADELHVSMRTVEVHRAWVYAKLGVRSGAEVATLLASGASLSA
ncbi:MAG: DNA-binding response regulator [Burkholderiales bacterium 28-67-8]|nr:MAG: DNA-binding response regulator [Burkholderiales bacterium 28-67-8]